MFGHCFAVPPDILDESTSTDMAVREGTNVTLRCTATGTPTPTVTWRRESGTIPFSHSKQGNYDTDIFNLTALVNL